MEDVELVIKIPEKIYKHILSMQFYIPGSRSGKSLLEEILKAIRTGTPLPKGHGNLKDIGKCNRKLFYQQCGGANSLITVKTAFDMLMALPTIIEADNVESEDEVQK